MNNTVRTYPRTLNDAFKGPDYACAIERRRPADRAVNWAWFAGAVVVMLAICFGVRP